MKKIEQGKNSILFIKENLRWVKFAVAGKRKCELNVNVEHVGTDETPLLSW